MMMTSYSVDWIQNISSQCVFKMIINVVELRYVTHRGFNEVRSSIKNVFWMSEKCYRCNHQKKQIERACVVQFKFEVLSTSINRLCARKERGRSQQKTVERKGKTRKDKLFGRPHSWNCFSSMTRNASHNIDRHLNRSFNPAEAFLA